MEEVPHRPASRAISPGPAGPFSLKTVHWTVFRALEPPEGEGYIVAAAGEGMGLRQNAAAGISNP